jgi:hypothetical protein
MKILYKTIAATMVALSAAPMLATHAMAATYTRGNTVIEWNGTTLLHAVHLVAVDPWSHESTSWLPVYYLNEAMQKAGFTAAWDGTTGTWSLTVPSTYGMPPDVSNAPSSQATNPSNMAIALNGTVVAYAPRLVAPDPYSDVETTYIPIYYVMQVMTRVGMTPTWNGLDWDVVTTSVGATDPATSRGSSSDALSQKLVATTLWTQLNGLWDAAYHPTMSAAGVLPTTAPATAGDVAQWMADWASHALGYVDYNQNGVNSRFRYWSLDYVASQNPYTWASINGLYENTDIQRSEDLLNTRDWDTIQKNLQWWLHGGETLADGKIELHVPLYSRYNAWKLISGNVMTRAQYDTMLTDDIEAYDAITVQREGANLLVTLPNTQSLDLAWTVTGGSRWAGYGYQGGSSGAGDWGGLTLTVPDNGSFLGFDMASMNANADGLEFGIPVTGGTPNTTYTLDGSDLQSRTDLPTDVLHDLT